MTTAMFVVIVMTTPMFVVVIIIITAVSVILVMPTAMLIVFVMTTATLVVVVMTTAVLVVITEHRCEHGRLRVERALRKSDHVELVYIVVFGHLGKQRLQDDGVVANSVVVRRAVSIDINESGPIAGHEGELIHIVAHPPV